MQSRNAHTSVRSMGRVAVWAGAVLALTAAAVIAHSRTSTRTTPTQALDPNLRGAPIDSAIAKSPIAPPVETAAASSSESTPVMKRDYLPINFTLLSLFPFKETEEMHDLKKYPQATAKTLEQIPSYVKTYDGRKVELEGYMVPLIMKDGLTTKFLLMANQASCCYGTVPQMNEWVEVDMPGKGVKDLMDVVIRVSGTFRVGENRTPKGLLSGIYRMDGEKLEVPEPELEAETL